MVREKVPEFAESCQPPEVLGTAVLTTTAFHGASHGQLEALIARQGEDPAARLFDAAIAAQLAFRRAEGLGYLDQALAVSRVFRLRRETGRRPVLRLLALAAPGDLMANAPVDFITNALDVRLDLLFVVPDAPLPAVIPDHDVMICAAGEGDAGFRARLGRLYDAWPRPVLNDPRLLPSLARDRLPLLLAGIPGLCSPPSTAVDTALLDRLQLAGDDIGTVLPGAAFPVLLRPLGSHAGTGLAKVDTLDDLSSYRLFSTAASHYLTEFVDYRSPDGFYRKYRVAFIDRQPYLCHMAVSERWMIHYLNAGMTESVEKRADEARAMASFDHGFARRHRDAFTALTERLPFDYFSIDCGETPDGRLLVFEADTAAIVHLMDPVEMFPYKHPQMRRVFAAFDAMLHARLSGLPLSPRPLVCGRQQLETAPWTIATRVSSGRTSAISLSPP